jgi:hypothetical protein
VFAGPPGAGDGPANDENAKLSRVLSGLVAGTDDDECDPGRRYLRGDDDRDDDDGSGGGGVIVGVVTRIMVSVLDDCTVCVRCACFPYGSTAETDPRLADSLRTGADPGVDEIDGLNDVCILLDVVGRMTVITSSHPSNVFAKYRTTTLLRGNQACNQLAIQVLACQVFIESKGSNCRSPRVPRPFTAA